MLEAPYHALSEEERGLPRSYLIKQCRSDINSSFTIRRTPGELVGAQISFKEEFRRKIRENVSSVLFYYVYEMIQTDTGKLPVKEIVKKLQNK